MSHSKPTELTVHPRDVRGLFAEPQFDPFLDNPDALLSVAQVPLLADVTPHLGEMKLRILLPSEDVTPQTKTAIERALTRFCSRKIREARVQLIAWRRSAISAMVYSLIFFAISLALSAAVLRASFIPETLRTLASESLIIAGWVIMWQPMDTLLQGWLPIRAEERTFRAIASMRTTVEAAPEGGRV